MYRPTTRVLATLELLQAHRQLTGRQLAEKLEVHLRTARRYVEILQDLGIPIEVVRGPHGGYRLRPDFKLLPLMFSDAEAAAVVLGLLAARNFGMRGTDPATATAWAKLQRVLPPDLVTRTRALVASASLMPADEVPPVAMEVVAAVNAAVSAGRQVTLRYCSRRGEITERGVDPYGVVRDGGRWYLIGYCHLRAAQRLFRLDRVSNVVLREDTVVRPDQFDARAEVERAIAGVPDPWTVSVWLESTATEARASLWPLVGTITEHDNGVVLHLQASDLDWMARHLAGTGIGFRVLAPPELNDALRHYAEEILTRANGSPGGGNSEK
jgi:predicted DNA-binding transcriptional regulator YafY